MAFNDFSWLSMLQKTFFCCLSDATEKKPYQMIKPGTIKPLPSQNQPIEIYYQPTFSLERFLCCCFWGPFGHNMLLFFFLFLHHDIICLSGTILKLIYREWEYRNNPMSIWQKEFTGCKIGEKRREGEGVSSAKKINPTDHSSSLPLASDWS